MIDKEYTIGKYAIYNANLKVLISFGITPHNEKFIVCHWTKDVRFYGVAIRLLSEEGFLYKGTDALGNSWWTRKE